MGPLTVSDGGGGTQSLLKGAEKSSQTCLVYLVCLVFCERNGPDESAKPADYFSIPLKMVGDAGEEVKGVVHAAEPKAGRIKVCDRRVVVLPFHKETPFLCR